jgi:hypothetical protein
VGEFDLFGVSFAAELGFANLLTALGLVGIPLQAVERPIVMAGARLRTESSSKYPMKQEAMIKPA